MIVSVSVNLTTLLTTLPPSLPLSPSLPPSLPRSPSLSLIQAVSVGGLLVNLVGIVAFRHAHAHSHGGASSSCHSHGQSHGHSHGHGHGHGHQEPAHDRSVNMEGQFLLSSFTGCLLCTRKSGITYASRA